MTTGADPSFAVVGAGLGGALMAAYLGKAGFSVDVYERRADPRQTGADQGRSINLAISTRGLHALSEVGVAKAVLKAAVPMPGRMMHAVDGTLTFQPYGTETHHVINSVSRAELNMLLLDAAERLPTVRLHFDHKLADFDVERGELIFDESAAGKPRGVRDTVVIGADGAYSAIRSTLVKQDRFEYQQAYLEYGYKELTIPPTGEGGFRLEAEALHIWPRGGYMMIALPNRDGSFTCTLFWPYEGDASFTALRTESDVAEFFQREFPDAVPHMPDLVEEYLANPVGSLVTIRCGPWVHGDRIVLLGDAAHAVVPFYGQGANAAFEDCSVLNECITRYRPDWGRAFHAYYALRKTNADALADLAIDNFVEMRDRVASGRFLWKKRTEKWLHRLFPRWFVPLYTMVSFTRIPYAVAAARARRQDRVVRAAGWALAALVALGLGALWI